MSKLVTSISLYFFILLIISFVVPAGYESNPNINITELGNSTVSSETWDVGDNLSLFVSFFAFSAYNPAGLDETLINILSAINVFMLILFVYAIIVLIRGGGNA